MSEQTQFKVGDKVHFNINNWNVFVNWTLCTAIYAPKIWKFIVNHQNHHFTIISINDNKIRLKELDVEFPKETTYYDGNWFRPSDFVLERVDKHKTRSNKAFRKIISR